MLKQTLFMLFLFAFVTPAVSAKEESIISASSIQNLIKLSGKIKNLQNKYPDLNKQVMALDSSNPWEQMDIKIKLVQSSPAMKDFNNVSKTSGFTSYAEAEKLFTTIIATSMARESRSDSSINKYNELSLKLESTKLGLKNQQKLGKDKQAIKALTSLVQNIEKTLKQQQKAQEISQIITQHDIDALEKNRELIRQLFRPTAEKP